MTVAVAAGAVFLGAGLQSAIGFGFALVSAPILFVLLGPQEAVSAGALLGIELSLLTLATERRAPHVLRGETLALIAWSLPGLALGAVALRELPDRVLSVLVAGGVLAALGLRLRARRQAQIAPLQGADVGPAGPAPATDAVPGDRAREPGREAPWLTAAAGLSSGALSTATSLSGPPLVLHLLARGVSPQQMRDTLAAVFVALAVLSVAALLIAGSFVLPSGLVVLLVAGLAGQLLGRRGFALLRGARHEDAVLAVLAVTAIVALASSVL
ncbi:MAG: sulfite exporter TauE/SafE family protein [Solirubrobacteraceae bacterium]